jgi:multicomponent K+:H+ antiporter subunit G
MSGVEHMPLWAAATVALLLVLGGSIVLVGALGLLRLPSFYQRIHGPAIVSTLGAGCLLLASILHFSVLESRLVIHQIVIALFLPMTAPVTAMLLIRAAAYRDLRAGKRNSGVAAGDVYRLPDGD